MIIKKSGLKLGAVFIGLTLLVGCSSRVDYRGKLPEMKDATKIVPGKSTETDVLSLIGSPTLESMYGSKQWVYVYKKEERTAFFKPTLTEKNMFVVDFSDQGVVQSIQDVDADFSELDPLKYKTKTIGQDRPLLQQIFSNFGRLARQNEKK